MYLFFDTETTGLPKNWNAPESDFNNWPRLVQLAFILFDENGKKISSNNYIIKPDNFVISKEASDIHRITQDIAVMSGFPIIDVLNIFSDFVNRSSFIIGHNISFDTKVVGSEYLRYDFMNVLKDKPKICTMESSVKFCAIKTSYGYKWPKLSELHFKLFGYNFEEAHNAFIDVEATSKCFWELKKRGYL